MQAGQSGLTIDGMEIYRSYDEFGPIIVVDRGNRRLLAFAGEDEQSCQLLDDPTLLIHEYNRTMMLALLFEPVRHATLLGLGGGSLAQCLWNRLGVPQVQVVELRRRVVKVARKYFAFPGEQQIPVAIADAQEYMLNAPSQLTDLILCDVFSADGFDISLLNTSFFCDCHRHLTVKGWLVINAWLQPSQLKDVTDLLYQNFNDVRLAVTLEGNYILFAGKSQGPDVGRSLELAARALSPALGFSLLPPLKKLTLV